MDKVRYARHLVLDGFGEAGQRALGDATVMVVGLGGLGCPAALYLASSGVGRLLLNDFDVVDPTNLARQILYRNADVGKRKVDAAHDALAAVNPDVELVRHDARLDARALREVMSGADVVLDCSDNFGTRFSLNDACAATGTPLVSGSAIRFDGQVASFSLTGGNGPCYACLYDEGGEALEDCAGNGVLAPMVATIGIMVAVEAIRRITGIGPDASGRLLRFDAQAFRWSESRFQRDPACAVCR